MHCRASVYQTAEDIAPFLNVDQYRLLIQWRLQIHILLPASLRESHERISMPFFYVAEVIQNGCQDDKYRLIGQEGSGILCLANN